jgi:hypothetical protein
MKPNDSLPPFPAEDGAESAGAASSDWDDPAFVQRVEEAAAAKGLTVREALIGAGVAGDYLNKSPVFGRNIGQVFKIARHLGVDPGHLMGLKDYRAKHGIGEGPSVSADQIARLALVASIAAHIKLALEPRPEVPADDTRRIVEAVLRAVTITGP